MPIEDQVRVSHMLDAAREIEQFTRGKQRFDLESNRQLFLSLLALFQILGEAAKHVSVSMRNAHPEVEWSAASKMRDRLAHGYFDIDYDILWDTSAQKIPMMISQLEGLVSQTKLDLG